MGKRVTTLWSKMLVQKVLLLVIGLRTNVTKRYPSGYANIVMGNTMLMLIRGGEKGTEAARV